MWILVDSYFIQSDLLFLLSLIRRLEAALFFHVQKFSFFSEDLSNLALDLNVIKVISLDLEAFLELIERANLGQILLVL